MPPQLDISAYQKEGSQNGNHRWGNVCKGGIMKLSILICVFLMSCEIPKEERHNVKYEFVECRLDAVNPPKHFYVDLTDIKTGIQYKHVYMSKHCNNWRNLTIGDTVVLKREMWYNGGNYYSSFFDLYSELCERYVKRN